MSLIRLSRDFIFGTLLIGGAPMCVMSLTVILEDLCQSLFRIIIPEGVGLGVSMLMFLTMTMVFAWAIRFRFRQRLLPRGFLVAEVLLGIVGALFLFSFYGVVMYSSIG